MDLNHNIMEVINAEELVTMRIMRATVIPRRGAVAARVRPGRVGPFKFNSVSHHASLNVSTTASHQRSTESQK